jgi:hypothetical protein
VTLQLATTSGTGAATFTAGGTIAPGGASTAITATTTVTISGVTASSTAGNITLTAYYPTGDGGLDELAQQTFSVVAVAVPVNFR